MISRILSEDHKAVEVRLKNFIKSIEDGKPSTEDFERARRGLYNHIYWEETFLFPSVEHSSNTLRIHGLEVEHGGIWKLLGKIEEYVQIGKPDLAVDRLEGLLRVLSTHNEAEEGTIYQELEDHSEDEQVKLIVADLGQACAPEGWVCKTIQRYS